jgi:hypothetical protein
MKIHHAWIPGNQEFSVHGTGIPEGKAAGRTLNKIIACNQATFSTRSF